MCLDPSQSFLTSLWKFSFFLNIAGNDFFFYFLGLSGTPKSPGYLRQNVDVGSKNNQKIHQWSAGSVRHKLTYKAERLGMIVQLQDEHSTSKTCPVCEHKRKTSPSGRVFTCTKKECKWQYHRDGVGAINIRRKYLGLGPVIGDMAPPTGMGFRHHSSRSSFGKPCEKFDPGNGEEAAMAF